MDDVAFVCRFLIGVVFAVSVVSKVAGRGSFGSFVRSLMRMRVVPQSLARPLSVVVVAGEVAIVALLAVPVTASGVIGFAIACALLTGFAVAIVSVLIRGIDTSCRCFGKSETSLGPQHVVRNLFLIAAAILGLATEFAGAPAELGALLIAAVTGLVLAALVIMFDDIIDLFQTPARR